MKEKANKIIDIISIVLSVISIVFTVIIGINQYKLDKRSAELENIFRPINYVITLGVKKFNLEISDDHDMNYKISQYYPNIEFVTGSIHKMAIIVPQTGDYNVFSVAVPPGNYTIQEIRTDIPQKQLEYNMNYAYDYFFLYLEDANGDYVIDLIYYQIDLKNRTISDPKSYSKIDLLKINESNNDVNEKEMLKDYRELLDRIKELDL